MRIIRFHNYIVYASRGQLSDAFLHSLTCYAISVHKHYLSCHFSCLHVSLSPRSMLFNAISATTSAAHYSFLPLPALKQDTQNFFVRSAIGTCIVISFLRIEAGIFVFYPRSTRQFTGRERNRQRRRGSACPTQHIRHERAEEDNGTVVQRN